MKAPSAPNVTRRANKKSRGAIEEKQTSLHQFFAKVEPREQIPQRETATNEGPVVAENEDQLDVRAQNTSANENLQVSLRESTKQEKEGETSAFCCERVKECYSAFFYCRGCSAPTLFLLSFG